MYKYAKRNIDVTKLITNYSEMSLILKLVRWPLGQGLFKTLGNCVNLWKKEYNMSPFRFVEHICMISGSKIGFDIQDKMSSYFSIHHRDFKVLMLLWYIIFQVQGIKSFQIRCFVIYLQVLTTAGQTTFGQTTFGQNPINHHESVLCKGTFGPD